MVLLAVFAVIELRLVRTPLVPFGLFRSRSVTGANIVMFLVGAAFFAMWYFLSLYLQNVLGYSALRAGLAFLPMAVAIIIGAQASSRLLPRIGVRPLLLAGNVLATVGFAWLSRIAPTASYWQHVFGPGCIISLALGVLFTPLAAAATAGVSFTEAGLASGVLNTSRQIGGLARSGRPRDHRYRSHADPLTERPGERGRPQRRVRAGRSRSRRP